MFIYYIFTTEVRIYKGNWTLEKEKNRHDKLWDGIMLHVINSKSNKKQTYKQKTHFILQVQFNFVDACLESRLGIPEPIFTEV